MTQAPQCARSARSAALLDMHSAAVVEEAGERSPALEAVVDGLAGIAVLGDPGALLAQPAFKIDDKWPAVLMAHAHALAAASCR